MPRVKSGRVWLPPGRQVTPGALNRLQLSADVGSMPVKPLAARIWSSGSLVGRWPCRG
jgi:hypothetical protein